MCLRWGQINGSVSSQNGRTGGQEQSKMCLNRNKKRAGGTAPGGVRLVRAAGAGSVTGTAEYVCSKERGPSQAVGRH